MAEMAQKLVYVLMTSEPTWFLGFRFPSMERGAAAHSDSRVLIYVPTYFASLHTFKAFDRGTTNVDD